MSALVLSRRSILEAALLGAGALVAAGFPAATALAAASSTDASAAMLAAWVVLRPEAGADVQFAYLSPRGRPLHVLPTVRLEARETARAGGSTSAWGQAQEAAVLAQSLAVAMAARAWGAPTTECQIRPGWIEHPASGRSISYCVWLDIT